MVRLIATRHTQCHTCDPDKSLTRKAQKETYEKYTQ